MSLGEVGPGLSGSAEGTALTPAQPPSLQRAPPAEELAVALPPYRTTGLTPRVGAARLYAGSPVPRVDTGVHDSAGVRMIRIGGRLYDHPVGQAQYGLGNLASYRRTRDAFYLRRAVAQANRLISRRVTSRGGWYFPYPFDWVLHGRESFTLQAPWYSGMAQGLGLALFCRLYSVTGNSSWLNAAHATFASHLNGPSSSAPWTSWVDPDGYLWLEEYPRLPSTTSDRTLNGYLFAVAGVHEYWTLTRSAAAARLFDGAATTIARYVPAYRSRGWISRYCLAHTDVRDPDYHAIHERLLLSLYTMTAHPVFARYADWLRYDFPYPSLRGTVEFAAGAHRGYQFTQQGKVTGSKVLNLTHSSRAPADRRARIYGRSYFYRITAGGLAGYWVAEDYPSVRMLGIYHRHDYLPDRTVRFAPGSYTGYRIDHTGRIVGSKTARFGARGSSAPSSVSEWIEARPFLYITRGTFAGHWLLMQRRLTLI
jgi:hypothetical protein